MCVQLDACLYEKNDIKLKKSMSKIDCNNFVNWNLKKGIDLKSKNLLKLLTNFSLRDIIYSTNEGRTK